jgi:hypothetical protein
MFAIITPPPPDAKLRFSLLASFLHWIEIRRHYSELSARRQWMENFSDGRLIKSKMQKLQDLPFAKLTAALITK